MMRRISSKFIPRKFSIHPTTNYTSCFLIQKSKPLSNITHFPLSTPFQSLPCRSFATYPDNNQQKKLALKTIFDSAESLNEMLKAFFDLESACFDDENNLMLGVAAAQLAFKSHFDNQTPELMLTFGKKASLIFTNCENDTSSDLSFIILKNLYFTGLACSKLNRVEESLAYLSKASLIGSRLLEDDSFSSNVCDNVDEYKSFLSFICVIEKELFDVKRGNGMDDCENVRHLRKGVDFQEKYVEENDLEFANNCKVLTATYAASSNFKEALPFCLKALKIYGEHFGQNSVEVALTRTVLGTVYDGLEDYEKALEQHSLSMSILKKVYPSSGSVDQEITCAEYLIRLGRKEEAIGALKAVVPHIENYVELRGEDFLAMAEGYDYKGKFDIFKEKDIWRCDEESYARFASEAFSDLSRIYEMMDEHESAISFLRRWLMMPEKLPLELHSYAIARYFYLIDLTGKVEEEISYMEVVVLKMKEKFGSKHLEVGNAYLDLGAVYLLKLYKPEKAAEFLTNAKDIMDASLGPNHEDSIKVCRYLVATYDYMGRHPLAIDIQMMVIERLKGKKPRKQDELDAAARLLDELELLKEKGQSWSYRRRKKKAGS